MQNLPIILSTSLFALTATATARVAALAVAAAPPPNDPGTGTGTAASLAATTSTMTRTVTPPPSKTTAADALATHDATYIHPDLRNNTNYLRLRADKPEPVLGVYVCEHANWSGNCVWQRLKEGVCMGLPLSEDLIIGPDIGIQCRAWLENDCKGQATSGDIVYPGTSKFKTIWRMPHNPVSYMCKKCEGEPDCGKPGVFIPWWAGHPTCLYPLC